MQTGTFRRIFSRVDFLALAFATALSLGASGVHAQATRTWVSGVGDDVNPCSRTAPCKTFAGAISKTAGGGEIDVMDPGGFGSVTITKSILLDGSTGAVGSILFSGVTGININATAAGVVILRNLSLNGAGVTRGPIAINVISAAQVFVENVKIQNSSVNGIVIQNGAGAQVFVQNSSFINAASDPSDPTVADTAAIQVKDANSVVYVSNSSFFGNYKAFSTMGDAAPLTASGGKIISYNNNRYVGNGTPALPDTSAPTQIIYER